MKLKHKHIDMITAAIIGLVLFTSCEDELGVIIPYPNDITFNEMTLDRFSYEIPTAPFTVGDDESGVITVNVSDTGNNYSGFALSNKNFRSYPWNLSPNFAPVGGLSLTEVQEEINTTAFSVYTDLVNRTENYLVGNTDNDNAFFTLSTPGTVEHVLVANTSYNYLLTSYGAIYSDDLDLVTQSYLIDGGVVANPMIENPDIARYGVFTLPGIDGTLSTIRLAGTELLAKFEVGNSAGEAARQDVLNAGGTEEEAQTAYDDAYEIAADTVHKGYVKLTIEGSLNGSTTGTVDVYLAIRPEVDSAFPEYNYILNDWKKVDLTALGDVDKVLFTMSSDYLDTQGKMVYPSMFCLDGIRLSK
ncbi:hypothetical protein JCM19274_256 [Algibacter lectus]|uniref:DUF4465 domain-containing protein n=1 Tax=Algibacter lectus TaxID=221126 RepID=A0A090X0C4_9FLAO|nr:DUF4465 domain-containing protein [Algibacter lectus]GAL82691.1 hypothetical protein JCM19274_256 [Algibacter lectus]